MLNDKIYSVDLMWSKAGGDFSLTDNYRKLNGAIRSAYQVFAVPEATINDVLQAPGIPAAGSSYSVDYPFVFADTGKPERISPVYWIVYIDYSGEVKFGADGRPQSPLLAPARLDWDDVEQELEIDEDYNGNPIVTANGEPINGVRRLFADQTVTIRKNMLLFSPFVQARYRQSVNSDSFLGWPPGTAKMQKFQATNVKDPEVNGGGYWEVTAVVQFRYPYRTVPERAWYARARHEGYYERIDLTGPGLGSRIVRAVDGNKEPVTKPVLLDANGYRIPASEPGQAVTAYWLEFKRFDSLPFNALGLLT